MPPCCFLLVVAKRRPPLPPLPYRQGVIPESISGLKHLRHLYLNDNELTGTIPASIGELRCGRKWAKIILKRGGAAARVVCDFAARRVRCLLIFVFRCPPPFFLFLSPTLAATWSTSPLATTISRVAFRAVSLAWSASSGSSFTAIGLCGLGVGLARRFLPLTPHSSLGLASQFGHAVFLPGSSSSSDPPQPCLNQP